MQRSPSPVSFLLSFPPEDVSPIGGVLSAKAGTHGYLVGGCPGRGSYYGFDGLILTLDISFSLNRIIHEQGEKVRNLPI